MTSHIDDAGVSTTTIPGEAPVWDPANLEGDDAPVPAEPAASPKAPLLPAGSPRPRVLQPRRTGSATMLLAISAIVAVGGIGFAVGHALAPAGTGGATANNGANGGAPFANGSFVPGGRGGFGGTATVSGTVVSVGTDSLTVKLASGETVTIATGSSTTYHAQTSSSSSDLATGQTVLVQTTGGDAVPGASASAATQTTRTATDVTITSN